MKINISRFVLALFVTMSVSSGLSATDAGSSPLYTRVNIWYENPKKILSTNYHKGAIIPVGTEVVLEDVRDSRIVFTDKNGGKFRIVIVRKHNNVPGPELARRLFSETSPLAASVNSANRNKAMSGPGPWRSA